MICYIVKCQSTNFLIELCCNYAIISCLSTFYWSLLHFCKSSTWYKQRVITLVSFSLLQRNRDFELLLKKQIKWCISFYHWTLSSSSVLNFYKSFFKIYKYFTQCNQWLILYCKFRFAWLCPAFTNPVTYYLCCHAHFNNFFTRI